ncbi:hypothetical protein [Bradyrhizobium japonicum]|nr:hypothetical protein [Bradyrhizobium japonicum]UQE03403.1 hypothetical protein JEY30_48885 [Bradyrhizobium japonicum]
MEADASQFEREQVEEGRPLRRFHRDLELDVIQQHPRIGRQRSFIEHDP